MPTPTIRQAEPRDLDDLYRVCLLTGDSGEDASLLYRDPLLLGHVYAAPYLVLEPRLAFVLEDDGGVAGYVLGALDSREFEARLAREWYPPLRERYPLPDKPREEWSPDERMIGLIHREGGVSDDVYLPYPSHLHIDLLPRAQGGGNGRRLMETLLGRLREFGSPGVHLGVGSRNERAIGFYKHVGFQVLKEVPGALMMGMKL
ncbi:MAG TPA: GNAT family N-acetyltransferase [Deinococcales bacterium]|nr:GNAT family N-acetyltransferase [Deinococcales bacterium]